MSDEERKILDFLLNTDFNIESGFSYTQLINFLNDHKKYYKALLDNRELYKYELDKANKTILDLESIIKVEEEKLEKKNEQFKNLINATVRKLTLKERLFGRFKF